MLPVFRFAGWRAQSTLLPRFCNNPQATIGYVRKILARDDPANGEKRRPYTGLRPAAVLVLAAGLVLVFPDLVAAATDPAAAAAGAAPGAP